MQIDKKTEFTKVQYDEAYPDGVQSHYWNMARNNIIKSVLVTNDLMKKKILEIGCGPGYVVDYLRGEGCSCVGVDISSVHQTKEYLFFGKDFGDLDIAIKEETEVILLLDVLEHVLDPEEFVSRIQKTFSSVQYILITVPARKELWSNYDEYYGHMTRYNLSSMSAMLNKIGAISVHMSYFFHMLYFPAYILLAMKKSRDVVVTPPSGVMSVMHRILAIFFILEWKALPRLLPGTSIICLAKTKQL